MTTPKPPSESPQENNPTDNPEDIKKKEKELKDEIDYKAEYIKLKATEEALLIKVKEAEEIKRGAKEAQRKQLEEKVKIYFPDLVISPKDPDSYLEGMLVAGEKYASERIDEKLRVPNKGSGTGPVNWTEEKKLINKLLDG